MGGPAWLWKYINPKFKKKTAILTRLIYFKVGPNRIPLKTGRAGPRLPYIPAATMLTVNAPLMHITRRTCSSTPSSAWSKDQLPEDRSQEANNQRAVNPSVLKYLLAACSQQEKTERSLQQLQLSKKAHSCSSSSYLAGLQWCWGQNIKDWTLGRPIHTPVWP